MLDAATRRRSRRSPTLRSTTSRRCPPSRRGRRSLAAAATAVFALLLTSHYATACALFAARGAVPRRLARDGAGRRMSSYDTSVRVPGGADARPNGWWGMAIFVAPRRRSSGRSSAPTSTSRPDPALAAAGRAASRRSTAPLLLTALLLLERAAAAPFGERGARRAPRTRRGGCSRGASVVQVGYLAWQLHEYLIQLDQFSPQASAYASIYFTLARRRARCTCSLGAAARPAGCSRGSRAA